MSYKPCQYRNTCNWEIVLSVILPLTPFWYLHTFLPLKTADGLNRYLNM